jgi:hypothetical protein
MEKSGPHCHIPHLRQFFPQYVWGLEKINTILGIGEIVAIDKNSV